MNAFFDSGLCKFAAIEESGRWATSLSTSREIDSREFLYLSQASTVNGADQRVEGFDNVLARLGRRFHIRHVMRRGVLLRFFRCHGALWRSEIAFVAHERDVKSGLSHIKQLIQPFLDTKQTLPITDIKNKQRSDSLAIVRRHHGMESLLTSGIPDLSLHVDIVHLHDMG